ncbi:vacuolar sorting ATPase [Cyclospora cayetanensis]|uniref:Vacuolar sorting ATPase n=1 Tax=Cyclospora cayetanensis TaxID=88456 RepID=A0A1D3D184_9EIME|nr:vacuolar sorting ATPase [Cyclospora cayetanensis]
MEEYITRAEQLKQHLLLRGPKQQLRQRLLLSETSPAPSTSPLKPVKRAAPPTTAATPLSRSPVCLSPHGTPMNAAAEAGNSTSRPEADAAEGERIKQKIVHAILAEKPRFKWSDVAGLESAKEALQEAIILPSRFPSLFTGERRPWRGILLYGPPGTGKTFLAKALAAEADATILSVSAADLVSKWQGESEKLVRSLFEVARDRRPSIIFIDEIDSMCGSRSESDSESSRRMKTEFLIQMQGINFDLSQVLVLGATNTPWALDAAIRRRFSGSDISVLVRDALFEPIRRCRSASAFKQVQLNGRTFYTPCQPDDPDPTTRQMLLMSVPGDRLLPPEVTVEDFRNALFHARPSVSPEDLRMHVNWTEQFGLEGS